MKIKILIVLVECACCFFSAVQCWKISKSNALEDDFTLTRSDDDVLKPEFLDNISRGPEKLPIKIFELGKNGLEEDEGKEKSSESEVDEETIRKAEEMADKDLLNGLNRILKNNQTLKDVFRAENVYEIF